MEKKKLFLRFARLIYKMKSGEVVPEDLEDSLFYFGCTQAHLEEDVLDNVDIRLAFKLRSQRELDEGWPEQEGADLEGAVRIYDAITSVVFKAKDQGRAAFRESDKLYSFRQLNQLLERNGINTSTVKHLEKERYAPSLVEDRYKDLVDVIGDP